MHSYLIDWLQCPACRGQLQWTVEIQVSDRIETAEARCAACQAMYPVREGIGLFLTPDLPREDLWQQVDNRLLQYLNDHPEIEHALMHTPLNELNPADQFFRASVLEQRGDYTAAKAIEEQATQGLYTPEYRQCWQEQVDFVLAQAAASSEPIVDLASGRGYLVEQMIHATTVPIIVTDFSPIILRRNKASWQTTNLYHRISLLAFDARRTPFKDGMVKTMTTNVGLPNIENPGNLFRELRRILTGKFWAISHFYPENDGNVDIIQAFKLGEHLYREQAIAKIVEADFQVTIAANCHCQAQPTPQGKILAGMAIDGLPQVATNLEWCVLMIT